jgi:protein O-mannosyl-transferase
MSKHKSNVPQKPQNQANFTKKAEITDNSTFKIADSKSWIWGLVAAALGFILYFNTFSHDYCLDDFASIKDNIIVKGGIKNIGAIFTSEYRAGAWNAPGSLYRPFSLAMFAWEWQFSPNNAFLSHFINVLLYAFTGWLLFLTLRRVLSAWPAALAGATTVLFIAHPAHVEVVANIKSRDEIVMFLGMLGAIYGLWRSFSGSKNWLILSVFSFTIGIFSKESAITFFAIIPMTMYFFTEKKWGEIISKTALFLIPTALFLVARQNVLGSQKGKEATSALDNFILASPNLVEQKASAFMVVTKYFQTLLAPFNLVSEIGYSQYRPVGFSDWRALLGLAIILSLVGLFFWGFRKKNLLSFAAVWFLATFSIVSNIIITIGTSYGERLLYVPSLAFALAVAFLLIKVLKINALTSNNNLFFGILGGLAAVFGLLTINRNPAWKDSFSLYQTDIKTVPNSAKLNYHYALELAKKGASDVAENLTDPAMMDSAIVHYSKAIEIWPTYRDAFAGRGLAYFRQKKYDIAFKDYETALKYDPNDAKVLSNMGYIYFIRQDMKGAEDVYRRAVKADPRFVDAWRNLGATLAMQKRFTEAIPAWQEALKYIPSNDPTMRLQKATLNHYIYMGYRDSGQKELGEPYFQQAAAIDAKLPR